MMATERHARCVLRITCYLVLAVLQPRQTTSASKLNIEPFSKSSFSRSILDNTFLEEEPKNSLPLRLPSLVLLSVLKTRYKTL